MGHDSYLANMAEGNERRAAYSRVLAAQEQVVGAAMDVYYSSGNATGLLRDMQDACHALELAEEALNEVAS